MRPGTSGGGGQLGASTTAGATAVVTRSGAKHTLFAIITGLRSVLCCD
jgi:hypothetical protein